MKASKLIVCLITLLLAAFQLLAKAGVGDVADDDPGLFIVMMIILAMVITACLLTAMLVIVGVAICGVLIGCGILSIAAITALYHKSAYTGLKVALYLGYSIAGLASGGVIAALFSQLYTLHFQLSIILPGGVLGLLAGLAGQGSAC